MNKLIRLQFFILLLGTVFAWGNFAIELNNWLNDRACSTGCAVGLINPFATPCFFGALFFTLAFVLSILMIRKVK